MEKTITEMTTVNSKLRNTDLNKKKNKVINHSHDHESVFLYSW